MPRYVIEYYPPDGANRADPHGLHDTVYSGRGAARDAIAKAIGGSFGRWHPVTAPGEAGRYVLEAWHENRAEGCGGYVIVREFDEAL